MISIRKQLKVAQLTKIMDLIMNQMIRKLSTKKIIRKMFTYNLQITIHKQEIVLFHLQFQETVQVTKQDMYQVLNREVEIILSFSLSIIHNTRLMVMEEQCSTTMIISQTNYLVLWQEEGENSWSHLNDLFQILFIVV